MSNDNTPRAWIGTLGGYTAGRLDGRWYTADEWEDFTSTPAFDDDAEYWCFDVENVFPAEEMNHSAFVERARQWEELAENGLTDAWGAYVDDVGAHYATVDDFHDCYVGHYESPQHFAEELADDLGLIPENLDWPLNHIDWESAARDLQCGGDYSFPRTPMGVYVFRNN